MPAPKRLSRPRRLNASPAAGMFPHAVTLYNVAVRTGRGTVRSTVESSVTLLRGVFLDASRGADPDRNGLEGADGAVLYVPSGVEAVDAVTGELKAYLPPVEFWSAGDKSGFWTLAASSRSAPGRGFTFFVKGLAPPPEGTPPEEVRGRLEALYDQVYHVSRIKERNFGGLAHWEIGGV